MEFLPYAVDESGCATCQIVARYGEVELEYAAIRRGAGIFDSPHRGTLRITGNISERRDFLNRMLTQELKELGPGMCRQSFWLNRKGRIEADLLLIELGDRMLVDVDVHQAASAMQSLNSFIVMEDVAIEDATTQLHHVQIHGPRAVEVLAAASNQKNLATLDHGCTMTLTIDEAEVVVARRDLCGEIGLELIMHRSQREKIWAALLPVHSSAGADRRTLAGTLPVQQPETRTPPEISHVRAIGWHAFNIARIEAGSPLFNIDFNNTNLPHETGILRERVSFTKGCYLGQEVVARMENLGKPKQMLVGLKLHRDRLPIAGEAVMARNADGSPGDSIGVITSSTLSPMLSATPIGFAMIRSLHSAAGTQVIVNAEGELTGGTVGPLRAWPPS